MNMNININGSKNGALPIIASLILRKNIYYIKNIPPFSDIDIQLNILKQFNVKIWPIDNKNIIIDTTNLIIPDKIDYSKNTRGTYYFIGSSVSYDNDLEYTIDTGCKIDLRNIEFHITLLKLLGKTVVVDNNKVYVTGNCLYKDVTYTFDKPSVGATLNGLLMFSNSNGTVTFNNYAKDPYIINMVELLIKIGICIKYNSECITIYGNKKRDINNVLIEHEIYEDPIESLTYIIYSGINLNDNSVSNYTIGPININHLGETYDLLNKIGIQLIESNVKHLYYVKRTKLLPFNSLTDYFPKIYTDVQPFLTLLALFIDNSKTTITETIWNSRYKYISQFNSLGYKIIVENNKIIIDNVNNKLDLLLSENYNFECTDLRGGMALLLLMKKHKIQKYPKKMEYIDRGYHNYEQNIQIILNNSTNSYIENYNTKGLSNIHIGGTSKYYTEVFSENKMIHIINDCKINNIYYRVIGHGSNIYFSEYFNGMIIKNNCNSIDNVDDIFVVSSGISLIDFILYVAEKGYDLSKLSGIPGTIGGAIYGNAGAYGFEISEIVSSCLVINNNYNTVTLENEHLDFSYRNSYFKKNNTIIISAKIKIPKSNFNSDEIKMKIKDIITIRCNKFEMKNTLGSIFKNVTIDNNKVYVWKLIDELHLRNKIINNITISNNHPNIFINNHNASPNDMTKLLEYIMISIKEKYSIILEKEIQYII